MSAPARVWKLALAPLLIWTLHFFLAYGLMLAMPDAAVVPWLVVVLGLLCLGGLFLVYRQAGSAKETRILPAIFLAAVAVIWQSLVAFF